MTPQYLSLFPSSRLAVVRNLVLEVAGGIVIAVLLLSLLK